MSKRSRILGFGSAVLLVVAGIACAMIVSGGLGQNLAFVLVAIGLVEATSLVFYEVGLTEDRERERSAAERERARREQQQGATHPPNRSGRVRLDRMRGRPRRLR